MTAFPQPVFQHPFRSMAADLFNVARELIEDVTGSLEMDLNEDPPAEDSLAGRLVQVATELAAVANALDITQGNSDANGYPRWGQDSALPHALASLAELVKRHEPDNDLAGFVRDAGRVGVVWAEPPTQRHGAGLRTEIRLLWPELAEALDALVSSEKSRELNERKP